MAKTFQAFAAALLLGFQATAWTQTDRAQTGTTPSAVAQQVQGLAPQLVVFAGSTLNFQNLVNGLATAQPVTLVSLTSDGFTQTVTFTPSSQMSVQQIAATLEAARQALIGRGIATPNAVQLATALVGGTLPTATGGVQVAAMVPALPAGQAAAAQASAGTGASVSTTSVAATPLTIEIRPTQPGAAGTSTATGTSNSTLQRSTSESTLTRNTSDSPAVPGTTTTTTGTTATGTGTATPNGPPSPAAQMQGRR